MKRLPILGVTDVYPEACIERLRPYVRELRYRPDIDAAEAPEWIRDVEVWLMNSRLRVTQEILASAQNLQLILRSGVGLDHIDMDAAALQNIQVKTAAGANAQAVAEMAVGLLLNLLRNIHIADAEVRQFVWKREANRGHQLSDMTVGIIGYGHTGRAFANTLKGFGCKVMAYDKYVYGFGNDAVQECRLEDLYSKVDVISFHVPLNAETLHYGDAAFFARFQNLKYVLNLSRGGVVNTADVLHALQSGILRGAGLDVLEQEDFRKLSDTEKTFYQSLFTRKDILFTPHIGGWTFSSQDAIHERMFSEFMAWLTEYQKQHG
jgi:D-3-phosphoglycerate dehydrogenase